MTDRTELIAAVSKVQAGFCYMNCPHGTEQNWPHDPACDTLRQATDALLADTALLRENERLREALGEIRDMADDGFVSWCRNIARQALAAKPDPTPG